MAQLSSKTTLIEHDKWKSKNRKGEKRNLDKEKRDVKRQGWHFGKKPSGYNNNKKEENMLSWKSWSVLKIEVKINTFFHETRD